MSVLAQLFQLRRISVQHGDGVLRVTRGGAPVFARAAPSPRHLARHLPHAQPSVGWSAAQGAGSVRPWTSRYQRPTPLHGSRYAPLDLWSRWAAPSVRAEV